MDFTSSFFNEDAFASDQALKVMRNVRLNEWFRLRCFYLHITRPVVESVSLDSCGFVSLHFATCLPPYAGTLLLAQFAGACAVISAAL